jgi:acyl carrier protein
MKPAKEQIADVIYSSIDELNEMLTASQRLEKSPQTVILEPGGGLDSLGFINFVSLVEDKYFDKFGQRIVLAQTDPSRDGRHPFQSIVSLVEYIDSLSDS